MSETEPFEPPQAFIAPERRSAATGSLQSSTPLPQELLEQIAEHQENAAAANTSRAYRSDWAAFERWCQEHGQTPLPASGTAVAAYLTAKAALVKENGDYAYAPSTISRWLTSINAAHHAAGLPEPGNLAEVKATLAGIRRGHARPTRRVAPLLLADLKKILTQVDYTSFPLGVTGHRDAAILVMGFAGAFRRSEIASRRIGDVTIHPEDGLHVRLLTSKTDQEGRGAVKGLPFGDNPLTCPPCAFLRWVRVIDAHQHGRPAVMKTVRESDPSRHICRAPAPELQRIDSRAPLFPSLRKNGVLLSSEISGEVVNYVIKRRTEAAGLDPKRFGGHSLRAGFVTQALRAGASPSEVMRQTNHKNVATVEIYRREHNPLSQNAVTRLGL